MNAPALLDRCRGCLLGLAVGDAVGTTLEFRPPGTFTPINDMAGGGPFRLKPGEWTDDTSMALCLAESLVQCDGFNAHDQMERYVRWWKTGYLSATGACFDIGNTVAGALTRFLSSGNPMAGLSDRFSAGNGSLMRLAPVPIFFLNDPELAIHHAAESSRTTHASPEAIDACRYFCGLLIGALSGVTKSDLLASRFSPVLGLWNREPLVDSINAIASGSFIAKQPPKIRGTGYVVESLEAALWVFNRTENFRDGCLAAANLGDDADTTAAIFGQIAGAYYGMEGIPGEWRRKLKMADRIQEIAGMLVRHSQAAARLAG